jgi:excisionase family DNA binding protein
MIIPEPQPILYSRADAARAVGLSLSELKRIIKAGQIQEKRQGRRRLIPAAELQRFVDAMPSAGGR